MESEETSNRARKVSDFMTSDPICATLNSTVSEVAALMLEADIRHVPIVDQGKLIAMVSDRDVRTVNGFYLNLPAELTSRITPTVADFCDAEVFTVSPDDDISYAIDLMLAHKIGALPVVNPGNNKLVGIVSYIDVLPSIHDAIVKKIGSK